MASAGEGLLRLGRNASARDSAIQVAEIRVKRRAAERAHPWMREGAAQELNPKIGRMGAEDPSRLFPAESQGSAVVTSPVSRL